MKETDNRHGPLPSGRERTHEFSGKWITAGEFLLLPRLNVFHRQLDVEARGRIDNRVRNRHILFRREFELSEVPAHAELFFSADDYAKLYLNGSQVGQGPIPGYVSHTFYQYIDATPFLRKGKNILAVHSYYQGLINRVWVSGDNRHGFLCDLVCDGEVVLASDETFFCRPHTGYSAVGVAGYETQFLERYDASVPEIGFEQDDFDDSSWASARLVPAPEYRMFPSPLPALEVERIPPVKIQQRGDNRISIDFGAMYVGALELTASGKNGDAIEMRFGQELEADGSVRYRLRANCTYVEYFLLSGREHDRLNQFDYKSFRYVELILPEKGGVRVELESIRLAARHMPFHLAAHCRYGDDKARQVWNLCVRSIHYGVQEQIQDCMDREKGYYLGDGCYTMLTWCVLTADYSPMYKFIDDFLRTSFINPGLMTCANCSFMQEIAEYPLMMFLLLPVLAKRPGGAEFVRARLPEFRKILDFYREQYACPGGLLSNLDKWCVVEWPQNMRDGYDAEISEGKLCTVMHNAINAWYIGAIRCFNRVADSLNEPQYPGEIALAEEFVRTFYLPSAGLFRDSAISEHISMPGNIYAWFFGLCPDAACERNVVDMIRRKRLSQSLFFVTFPLLAGLQRDGEEELLHDLLTDDNAWLRMIREGATATFEGWGKETKWNTSLFHLTLSFAAVFLAEECNIGSLLDFRSVNGSVRSVSRG